MSLATIKGAPSATAPTVNPISERTAALEALFTQNYSHVMDAASGPGLSADDIDRLISATARHLDSYDGELADESFRAWVIPHLETAAAFTIAHNGLRESYRRVVLKGIWSVLRQCGDLGIDSLTVSEIESDVWTKIFLELDEWLAPGISSVPGRKPAKLATRLFAKSRFAAKAWKTTQLRRKARDVDMEDGEAIESHMLDVRHGYGGLYPASLRPAPIAETLSA
jgi:hypothetical protein